MPMNLSQASKLIRVVNQLDQLARIENGDQRWAALQKARRDYPEVNDLIADYIDDPPSEVFDYLIEDFEFDRNLIPLLDPKGQLRAKVEKIITIIQQLYKEREKQNA